jgi:hypothetical protein
MSETVAMHGECVVCLTVAEPLPSQADAVKVLLMMLARDIPGEQILRDLCFVHRRENDEHVKKWLIEEPA